MSKTYKSYWFSRKYNSKNTYHDVFDESVITAVDPESKFQMIHTVEAQAMTDLQAEIDRLNNKYDFQLLVKRSDDLQRENDELKDTLRHFEHECETIQEMKTEMYKLQQRIADYEKALEFYGDENNYNHFPATSHPDCNAFVGFIIEKEAGDKAREVLAKYKDK